MKLKNDSDYLPALTSICDINSNVEFTYNEVESCLEFHRYQFSTLVYGLVLDKKSGAKWKKERDHGSVEEKMREYYHFTNEEAKSRVDTMIHNNRYNSSWIGLIMDTKVKPVIAKINEVETNYHESPGIEITFHDAFGRVDLTHKKLTRKPMEENVEYYRVDNKSQLVLNYTGILADVGSMISDQFYRIGVKNMPYVYTSYFVSPSEIVKFKMSDRTTLKIDNKEISVADFMKTQADMAFADLRIMNETADVEYHGLHGEIKATSDGIDVTAVW